MDEDSKTLKTNDLKSTTSITLDNELLIKQKLLKSEITTKEEEAFKEYCYIKRNIKPDELGSWTIDELMKTIR